MDTPTPQASPSRSTSDAEARVRRIGAYAAALFLGGVFGLAVVMLLVRQLGPGLLPVFSAAEFRDARERWSRAAITDYDIEVVIRGIEEAKYAVSVRDGVVRSAQRDGHLLRQERTWGTWSVPGMFETIERDLAAVERHRQGQADAATPQLLLRAVFDQDSGLPRRYQRIELRRFGANQEVSWEVTRFEARSSTP